MRLGIFLFFLVGCGLLHRGEIDAPKIEHSNPRIGCSFPDWKKYKKFSEISEADLKQIGNCLEESSEEAFKKLHGKDESELTYGEIRTLDREKIIKLGIENEKNWNFIEEGLKLFHPQGKSAIRRDTIKEVVSWYRAHVPTISKLLKSTQYSPGKKNHWATQEEGFEFYESFFKLISPKYSLSLERARFLVSEAYALGVERRSRDPLSVTLDKVEAAWILKGLVLSDRSSPGLRGDFTGDALKALAELVIAGMRASPTLLDWLGNNPFPQTIPANLPQEAKALERLVSDYIRSHSFPYLEVEPLSWAIRKLDKRSQLYSLAQEVVMLGRRLTPKELRKPGLHANVMLGVVDLATVIAQDWISAGRDFGVCNQEIWNCKKELREALQTPSLALVALKGDLYQSQASNTKPGPRLSHSIKWEEALGRLAQYRFMSRLFGTFDPENIHQGKIPLVGEYEEDLKQTLDMAFTFLRFASVGQRKESGQDPEENVPTQPILVKPGSLYRVMGLIGDKWMPDGDGDNHLTASEFYSLSAIYNNISRVAQNFSWSGEAYYPNEAGMEFSPFGSLLNPNDEARVYGRRDYISRLTESWRYYFPLLHFRVSNETSKDIRESLYHSLIGNPRQRPISVVSQYRIPNVSGQLPRLAHYVKADAGLPVAAIITVLDRLMIRCDANEDDELNWVELDCATPLLLGAGKEVTSSGLIDLDPGVNDGAKVILEFLRAPGLPLSVAKLLMVNGTVETFKLQQQYGALKKWVDEKLVADFDRIATFIGAPKNATPSQLRVWRFEARRRFAFCDLNKDAVLSGPKELGCFSSEVIRQTVDALSKILSVPGEAFEKLDLLSMTSLFEVAIPLSTMDERTLNHLLTVEIPINSNPSKILTLLESIVRRAEINKLPASDFEVSP